MFIKKETRELGQDMINNPQDWVQRSHTFAKGGFEIWTANVPILSIDLRPFCGAFNVFEKIYLHRCIKKSRIKKALLKE